MLRMIRVEVERDYEELWKEYNKELLGEPFLPKKYKVRAYFNIAIIVLPRSYTGTQLSGYH